MKIVQSSIAPRIRLMPSEHLANRLVDRRFDLSVLLPLYDLLETASVGDEVEADIGRATIVAHKVAPNEAILTSGWRGTRH